jgi:hypothetical protein
VATSALVERDVELGRKLVAALALSRIPVTAAFWGRTEESNKWGIFVVTPLVDSKGRSAAYREVLGALEKNKVFSDIPWMRIFVVSPRSPASRSITGRNSTIPFETMGTLNADVGERFVEDAYLYSGSIHVVEVQKPMSNNQGKYSVVYAPYSGPGGAAKPRVLEGLEALQDFLEEEVRIDSSEVSEAVSALRRHGWTSIPNVILRSPDLKRLGLA